MVKKFRKNKDVLMIVWQDAAFSNRAKLPKKNPPMQITFGLFISENRDAINIGMNCHLDSNGKIIECRDAFLIPKKVIKNIKIISKLNE